MGEVQNVVAPQGTAFTDDHARILRRYTEEVVLCFDSDEAGQNAAVRSLEHLLGSGLAVRVAVVPAPHDPDSLIKEKGPEAFQQLVRQAQGFFDYYLSRLCALHEVGTDKGRLAIVRQMADATLKTRNNVLVDKYAQKTALRLGVSPESVRLEFRKHSRYSAPEPSPQEDQPQMDAPQMAQPESHEYWLLRILMQHDDLVPWAATYLDRRWVQHPDVKKIIEFRIQAYNQQSWTSLPAFLEQLPGAELQTLVTQVIAEDRPVPKPEVQLQEITTWLRNQFIDRQMNAVTHQASQSETPEPLRLELHLEKQALRRSKAMPLAPLNDSGGACVDDSGSS
jgi:DNA primase